MSARVKPVADQMAGGGDGAVEHRDLRLHLLGRGADRRHVGLAVLGERVADDVLADHQLVELDIAERDPLLDLGGGLRLLGDHLRAVEHAVDIGRDGLGLAQLDVAVAHHRDLAERMDRVDVRRVRALGLVLVGDALLGAHHAHGPDIVRLRHSDDFQRGHAFLRFGGSMSRQPARHNLPHLALGGLSFISANAASVDQALVLRHAVCELRDLHSRLVVP